MMYFASYRGIAGVSEEIIYLEDGSTVEALMMGIKELHEPLREVGRMLIAVNSEFADPSLTLKDGDMVALFPPVSGG